MLFTRPSFSWNANIDSLSHILRSGRKKKKVKAAGHTSERMKEEEEILSEKYLSYVHHN